MNTNMEKKPKKSYVITGLIIVLLSFLILTTGLSFYLLYRDTIYHGITIENIDIGGLAFYEANQKIANHFDDKNLEARIHFVYADRTWTVSNDEFGYSYDYTKALNEAYEVGRQGNYFERLSTIISLYKKNQNINLLPIYDSSKIDAILYNIKMDIDQPTEDATINRKNGIFVIADEKIGLKLNANKTKSLLNSRINELKYDKDINIDLQVESEFPRITSESLSTIQDLLGSYSTTFNVSNASRSQNITLAAKAINGIVLMAGDIFSFNDVVGPRSREKGYLDAPVIFNGELVEGLGGGVCQASSTIYNAALLSDLKIVERIKHSIPSLYVPKGRDATVSYGLLDFKFQNNQSHPIYIESYTKGDQMVINIFGRRTNNRIVKIHTVENEFIKRTVETKLDSELLYGQERIEQEGRDGYRVTTYKIVYENNIEVSREQVSKDYYKPRNEIVVKGTKKPPEVTNNAEENTEQKEDQEAGTETEPIQ